MTSILTRRRVTLLSTVAIAVAITAILVIQTLSTSIVEVSSASVTYQDPMAAYATFTNIGNYYVRADCANLTLANQCALLVSLSLANNNLYTRSMSLKVSNVVASTLAVGVSTYTEPPQQFTVGYGTDGLNTRLVTIAPSFVAPGGTWTFTVYVFNPPAVSGKPALNLAVEGKVVENHFLGRTLDLQSSFPLPGSS